MIIPTRNLGKITNKRYNSITLVTEIDFKVKDENLAEDGAITILLPDGESLEDVTFHSFNVTGIDDGVYDLKIMAVDLAENEQTKMISFNVDHAFVQPPPVISKEREPVSENNLLIIISAIIVAAIVILNYCQEN